jgi:hypothetical protein
LDDGSPELSGYREDESLEDSPARVIDSNLLVTVLDFESTPAASVCPLKCNLRYSCVSDEVDLTEGLFEAGKSANVGSIDSVQTDIGDPVAITAQKALRMLYGILALNNEGDSQYWHRTFPCKSVTVTCEEIMDFIVCRLPNIVDCISDADEKHSVATVCEGSRSGIKPRKSSTFDFLRRFADNLEAEHAKRTVSESITDTAAVTVVESLTNACLDQFSTVSNRVTCDDLNSQIFSTNPWSLQRSSMATSASAGVDGENNDDLQARLRLSIKRKSDEISDIEAKILGGVKGHERTTLEIRVKQLERSLLNDKIDLSVAASAGEFQQRVHKLQVQVAEVVERQDKVEEKQNSLEKKVHENDEKAVSELQKVQLRLLELEKESRVAKEERAEIKDRVKGVEDEQRHTRRAVDVVDNRQRKQNLVLFGLNPAGPDAELLKLLPESLSVGIDRVFSITQPDKKGRVGFSVQFKTVSACEKASTYLTSREFKLKNPHITTAQDESELTRVGSSRMRAIVDLLRSEFDGLHVGRDFVRLGKEKLPAADFALSTIRLGGKSINVDAAVAENSDAQVNPGLKTFFGGREINGVRLSRKRRHSGSSDETSSTASRRSGQHQQPRAEQLARNATSNNRNGGRRGRTGPAYEQAGDRTMQRRQPDRLTNSLPTLDGTSTGGVTFFNRGNSAHGGGHARSNVMSVSQDLHLGQPAYHFLDLRRD